VKKLKIVIITDFLCYLMHGMPREGSLSRIVVMELSKFPILRLKYTLGDRIHLVLCNTCLIIIAALYGQHRDGIGTELVIGKAAGHILKKSQEYNQAGVYLEQIIVFAHLRIETFRGCGGAFRVDVH